MCVSELKGKALPAHKSVLCIFHAETKTAKNIRKARSPLDSYGFSYIPREREREEWGKREGGEQVRQSVGRATKWI